MPRQSDTLLRTLTLLQLLPRSPSSISTSDLQQKLKDRGFEITLRSLQRDLNKLSAQFPLLCEDTQKPHLWSFDRSYNRTLPGMDINQALTWVMAEQYLEALMPAAVLDSLTPQFDEAHKQLDSVQANGHGKWQHKVRILPQHQNLLPAEADPDIWRAISEALLHHKAIDVAYLTRYGDEPKLYCIHPQAMVHRHNVSYVLATVKDYNDIRQFALHRFTAVKTSLADYRKLEDFSVDEYIGQGGFGYVQSNREYTLKAQISAELFIRLQETPLNRSQQLEPPDESGWGRLTTTVKDEQAILWWLQSMGAAIRVEEPAEYREELVRQAAELVKWHAKFSHH
ncbi:MAG: WYL domain-containing protein [Alkalimonas sp.]|nr:WYL domain-containing protein [Alkalimonas sp.]